MANHYCGWRNIMIFGRKFTAVGESDSFSISKNTADGESLLRMVKHNDFLEGKGVLRMANHPELEISNLRISNLIFCIEEN